MNTAILDASDREMFLSLQRDTFDYFVREVNPTTGLIADRTEPGSPSSITATGLGLTSICVAVEREWMSRTEAVARVLTTLRFLATSAQGPEADATGYRGFYYHFLDMQTGRRAQGCELSTIDTTFLLAGVLMAGSYFSGSTAEEAKVRALADAIYRRVDWAWATNGAATVGHGWTPERGFLPTGWNRGFSEALLLYVLALGSPTFPIAPEGYRQWTATFERKRAYGIEYLYAGPLFIHQLSHVWLDFRGIRDDRNRELDADYFENSRRATQIHQQYGIQNPRGFRHYSKYGWGLTASDGPGPMARVIDGVRREFFGYEARGAPEGPDDGTISPWAVVTSLPFEPQMVSETTRHAVMQLGRRHKERAGFDASFNPTVHDGEEGDSWASPWRFGLNEGPIVLMIENFFTELVWGVFMRHPSVRTGLRRAGFEGAGLSGPAA